MIPMLNLATPGPTIRLVNTWTELKPAGGLPPARAGHQPGL